MIKVLAHGKRYAICDNCGCVFAYEYEDIEDNSDKLGNPGDITYIDPEIDFPRFRRWVTCPDCGKIVYTKGDSKE